MRKILSALAEIRKLQLSKFNAPAEKLAEVGDRFHQFDMNLSGMKPTDTGTQIEETMTSADFTYAIMEFVQRLMIPGYETKGFKFEPFVKLDTAPNFLPVTRYQHQSKLDDLEYIGEKGERRPGHYEDAAKRVMQVFRWGKQFDFSMETLVDDDLGYFQDTARDMGISARRTLEKHVSNWIWNAVTTARLVALGALFSTTGRLTTARISAARMAFNQRVDARGEPIAAALKYIVIHPGLVDTAAQIQASELVPELATNGQNVVRGTFQTIEDPWAPGAAPNLPWFAMSDYSMFGIVPFTLLRRAGMPGPLLIRKKTDMEVVTSILGSGTDVPPIMGDFQTGNVVFAVEDQWGTYIDAVEGNMFDNRGCYYSSGTAP